MNIVSTVNTVILLLLLFVMSACTESQNNNAKQMSDNDLRAEFVGIWSATYDEPDYKVYGETDYRVDGTAIGRGEVCADGECTIGEDTMLWRIEAGVLIGEFTSITGSDIQVGTVFRDEILHLEGDTLIMHSRETGNTFTRKRVLNPVMLKR